MYVPYDKTFPTEPLILNMWPWPWPLIYFWKNFNIAHNFLCRLRNKATHRDHFVRHLSVCLSVRLSHSHSYVSQATHAFLGMLPLFFIIWDKAFIFFCMCVPYDKAFPMVSWILNVWPWPWPLTYFWKTLTFVITFLSYEIKLSYLACMYLMTRPFQWYHEFWTCDLDHDLWPTFEKL